MRLPVRGLTGHLVWADDGTVWAVWRVTPLLAYQHLSQEQKLKQHADTRSALVAVGGNAMVLSLCARQDAAAVVRRMVHGVDLTRRDPWVRVATATLDTLEQVHLWERTHWLVVKLPEATGLRGLGRQLGAAADQIGRLWGIVPAPAPESARRERLAQAQHIHDKLRKYLTVRPATPEEICWIYERAPRRGLDEPLPPAPSSPAPVGEPGGSVGRGRFAAYSDVIFFEGGQSGDVGRPRRRRYLKVEIDTDVGDAPMCGYQTFLALSEMPHSFVFPGTEFLAAVDAQGVGPVDWCVRIETSPNATAQAKARRQARQLQGQRGEYDGETAGVPSALDEAQEALDDQRRQLSAHSNEPELRASMVFCVWGDSLADCDARAEQLRSAYGVSEFTLARPTGAQLDLYRAMLPGAPAARVCRDYQQYLLPPGLAAAMPFAGSEVGDPSGSLLGFSVDGSCRPALLDPAYGVSINRSANILFQGALGGGKSYAMKRLAYDVLARGGGFFAIDRTPMGEWVHFARVAPGRIEVIRIDEGEQWCLEPLVCFSGPQRIQIATGYLSLLTGCGPRDLDGLVLGEAVAAVAERPGGRLRDVITELAARGRTDETARLVARKIEHLAKLGLCELAFGDGEVLDLSASDCVILHAPSLQLPDRDTISSDYQRAQMPLEVVAGQATVYLMAALGRSVAFGDKTRFFPMLADEAWSLRMSADGLALLLELLRDGRKHGSGLWVSSQSISDFPKELRDLIETWLLFRQSRRAAEESLAAMSAELDGSLIEEMTNWETGNCLLRDVRGRIGRVVVAPAPLPELHAAFDTRPLLHHDPLTAPEAAMAPPSRVALAKPSAPSTWPGPSLSAPAADQTRAASDVDAGRGRHPSRPARPSRAKSVAGNSTAAGRRAGQAPARTKRAATVAVPDGTEAEGPAAGTQHRAMPATPGTS